MNVTVITAFFKTLVYGCRLFHQTNEKKHLIKHKWGKMVLKEFGFKLNIKGKGPGYEPVILVGNHISYLDIPAIMAAEPESVFIAKDDLKKWPIIGPCAVAAGTVFIKRNTKTTKYTFKNQLLRILKNHKLVVFPSGTTTLYENLPWKKGIFKLAHQENLPIQLFRLDYHPLRESAYIDDDKLLLQMSSLKKIKDKTITLTWLEKFDHIDDPAEFCELARQKILQSTLKH